MTDRSEEAAAVLATRYMLTAYAKADRDHLTAEYRKALARLVAGIEREMQRR